MELLFCGLLLWELWYSLFYFFDLICSYWKYDCIHIIKYGFIIYNSRRFIANIKLNTTHFHIESIIISIRCVDKRLKITLKSHSM